VGREIAAGPGPLRLAGPLAAALILLGVVAVSRAEAEPAGAASGSVSVPSALQQAWTRGDVDGVVGLFAPEGVVVLDPAAPAGPDVYHRTTGAGGLRAGVRQLMADGAQVDVAGHRAEAISAGGAPATRLRWAYGRPGVVPAVPPEVGEDEVVLREGQIVSYTRVPDGAVRAARARALNALLPARTSSAIRAAPAPGSPRSEGGPNPVAALCGLTALGGFVLRKRSRCHRRRPAGRR
jgi:hypothetical protein